MYMEGAGVTRNYVQAHMWLSIAMANGREPAREDRTIAERRMTAADISKAQKLAKEWMAKHGK
jgi:TPR repeat protein